MAIFCEFKGSEAEPTGTGIEVFSGVIFTVKHALYKDYGKGTEIRAKRVTIARCDDARKIGELEPSVTSFWEHPEKDFAIIETSTFDSQRVGKPFFNLPAFPYELKDGVLSELFGFPAISDRGGKPEQISIRATCGSTMPGGTFQFVSSFKPSETWINGKRAETIDAALM
ncbi:MAG: hypothetical protein ABJZ69_04610, partial [Hyphomicrobiales bacterium]